MKKIFTHAFVAMPAGSFEDLRHLDLRLQSLGWSCLDALGDNRPSARLGVSFGRRARLASGTWQH
jgi:hypothetical protein